MDGENLTKIETDCNCVKPLSVKGAVHEIYQNSNNGNCHQIEWNINDQWKHRKKEFITQQKQKEALTYRCEEDLNGLKSRFLKTCLPNNFSNFIFLRVI